MKVAQEKIIFLGGSRGLGSALIRSLSTDKKRNLILISRKPPTEISNSVKWVHGDFSKKDSWAQTLLEIQNEKPDRVFFIAGGGPYGFFGDKKWTSHAWALNVSFLFPAFLLHAVLSDKESWTQLKQIVFVGSAIAESNPDPCAAMYAGAKHALRGLVTSVQSELGMQQSPLDLRMFSPGYLNTSMIPATAWPREKGLVMDLEFVGEKFLEFVFNPTYHSKSYWLKSPAEISIIGPPTERS